MPRRSSVFGVPPSTIRAVVVPSAFLLSMWIHACGLIHSTRVTGPRRFTGLLASKSAANAWSATAAAPPISAHASAAPAITYNFVRICIYLLLFLLFRRRGLSRLLAQIAVHQLLDEFDALELHQLRVRLDAPVQRHADFLGAREGLGILD